MEKVLITGGAGFIGANLARKLLQDDNFKVLIIEKENVNAWRLKDIKNKVNVNYVDLENEKKLFDVIKKFKPKIVVHLASYGVYPISQDNLEKMIDVNIKGTLNLLNVLKVFPPKYFINVGTCFEYKEKKSKLTEDDPTDPLNLYAVTKLTVSLLLKKIAEESNFSIVNLRLFTPYGYYEDKSRLIPSIILGALGNKRIKLSSPTNVRDFIFIEDVVNLFLKVIKDKRIYRGEIFNVGSGKQYSIGQIVKIIEELTDKKLQVRYGQKNKYKKEPKSLRADNGKARTAFVWNVTHDISSGIAKSIDWFKRNKIFYL